MPQAYPGTADPQRGTCPGEKGLPTPMVRTSGAEMMPHETSKPLSQMNHQSGSCSKLQMSTLGTSSGE